MSFVTCTWQEDFSPSTASYDFGCTNVTVNSSTFLSRDSCAIGIRMWLTDSPLSNVSIPEILLNGERGSVLLIFHGNRIFPANTWFVSSYYIYKPTFYLQSCATSPLQAQLLHQTAGQLLFFLGKILIQALHRYVR